MQAKRISVGVMGSAGNIALKGESVESIAVNLGKAIAKRGCILFTGETNGLPGKVIEGVREAGGITVGCSAAHSFEEHREKYFLPEIGSDVVIYTGFGLKGRNVITVRSSDIVIILSGSIGTLNEFTIAYDEGKVIGVLCGTGGVSDMIENIVKGLGKKTKAVLVYESDVEKLLDSCIEAFKGRQVC